MESNLECSVNTDAHLPLTRSGSSEMIYDTLPNPYRLSVMQQVYDDYSLTDVNLEPTDLYVRFMPRDTTELRILTRDYNLELFEYPMDIVLPEGEEYVNYNKPESDLIWVYTTVKPDFEFSSDVPYTILEECYIPEEGEVIVTTKGEEIDVETQAFLSLGYEIDDMDVRTKAVSCPSGRIEFCDTSRQVSLPVKGVKVRCHNIVKWASTFTNERGEYSLEKSFRTNVHYALVFENNKGFNIWGNWGPLAKANYNMGWHSNMGYSTVINVNSKAWDWAAVNDITYDYYCMCDTTSIAAPPQDLNILVGREYSQSYAPMISKLTGFDVDFNILFDVFGAETELDVALAIPFSVSFPDIVLGTRGRPYNSLGGLVGHELAHASHFSQVGSVFWKRYVNHIIKNLGYGDGTDVDSELCAVGEMWGYFMKYIRECDYNGKQHSSIGEHPLVNGWIPQGVFVDLCKKGYLTPEQIFTCLTSDIDTYEELYNKMLVLYPGITEQIEWAFTCNGIMADDTDLTHQPAPSDIDLGKDFDIYWVYSNEENVEDIEFSFVRELYFDRESNENITIINNDIKTNKATIILWDYGHYIIEARVKNTDIKRYFHIAKLYRTNWSAYNPLGLEGSLPVAEEPFTGTVTNSVSNVSPHYIELGVDAPLEGRTVAIIQQNVFMQKVGGDIRPDRRYFNVESDTLTFNPGSSFTIRRPDFAVIGGEWPEVSEESHLEYEYTKLGYYAVVFPDDNCFSVE